MQKRRGNVGKIKECVADHLTDIIIIGACLFFIIGCWWLYTEKRTANDYHHVTDTVQSAERDNREARQQINSAAGKVEFAEKQLNDSIKRTDRITERTQQAKKRVDDNSRIIGECQNLIDSGRRDVAEAREIFADIDQANQGNGTQTNRT